MHRTIIARAAAATLLSLALSLASAEARTARHRHHGGVYARDYADYHTSLPTRPRSWYRGDFRSNTYPTYRPGIGGCVDDLGYGRVGSGVCN